MIQDKGTFDVVVMNPDLSNQAYANAVAKRLSANGVFILTSCNLTTQEMDAIFRVPCGPFHRIDSIKNYPSFSFGGHTGQVVSTNVYAKFVAKPDQSSGILPDDSIKY